MTDIKDVNQTTKLPPAYSQWLHTFCLLLCSYTYAGCTLATCVWVSMQLLLDLVCNAWQVGVVCLKPNTPVTLYGCMPSCLSQFTNPCTLTVGYPSLKLIVRHTQCVGAWTVTIDMFMVLINRGCGNHCCFTGWLHNSNGLIKLPSPHVSNPWCKQHSCLHMCVLIEVLYI